MHPRDMDQVLDIVLAHQSWFALPVTSLPGGHGPQVWRAGVLGIFASDWVDYEANLYAKSWDKEVSWIEVPDVFVEQHGIR